MIEVDDRVLKSIHSKSFEAGDDVYCCGSFPNYERRDLLGFLKEIDHENRKALFHPYLNRPVESVWCDFSVLRYDHWSWRNDGKYKWKLNDPMLMMGGCVKDWKD